MSINLETWYGPIIAIGAAFGVLAHYFRAMRGQDERIDELRREFMEKIAEMREEVVVMKVRNDVVWQVLEKELPKVLIRVHTPRVDEFYVKQKSQGLTDDEKKEFLALLQSQIDETVDMRIDDDKRIGYILTIMKLRGDLAERQVRESFKKRDG